jgi:hypothetical protein
MTRHDEEQVPRSPDGHAAERRRQFEEERGLSDPEEVQLDQEEATDDDANTPTPPKEDEPPSAQND